jgi:hypothetical protein
MRRDDDAPDVLMGESMGVWRADGPCRYTRAM